MVSLNLYLKKGDADIMIAGGTEAAICPLAIAAFGKYVFLNFKLIEHVPSQPNSMIIQKRHLGLLIKTEMALLSVRVLVSWYWKNTSMLKEEGLKFMLK